MSLDINNKSHIQLAGFLLVAASICGCTGSVSDGWIAFEGPVVCPNGQAVLEISRAGDKVYTLDDRFVHQLRRLSAEVDGDAVSIGQRCGFVLLEPGRHKIVFTHKRFETDWKGDRISYTSYEPIILEHDFEAGRIYSVSVSIRGYSRYRNFNPYVQWIPRIIDEGELEDIRSQTDSDRFNDILFWYDRLCPLSPASAEALSPQ